MSAIEAVHIVTVDLKIDGELSLFVLLADDGSINRLGTGSVRNAEKDLYIGVIDNASFRNLRSMIQPEWLDMPGRYANEERKGPECVLSVTFGRTDAPNVTIQFVYGAESEGPPMDLMELAAAAVEMTAAWAREQKAAADRSGC